MHLFLPDLTEEARNIVRCRVCGDAMGEPHLFESDVRDELMAAGRHLSARRMGYAVTRVWHSQGFGADSKTKIVDKILARGTDRTTLDDLVRSIQAQDPQPQDIDLMIQGIKDPHQWSGFRAAEKERA